jgi:hypothetical protein
MNAQNYNESTEEYTEQVRKKVDEKLEEVKEKVTQKLENTLDNAKASRKESGMSDEKLRILQMIKDGTLTPEEGLDLIQALDMSESSAGTGFVVPASQSRVDDSSKQPQANGKRKPRFLRIKVDDEESNKKVNIRIPIALAKFAGKFIPKHARHEMKEQGVEFDLDEILNQLENSEEGMIEVREGDNKIVQIYCE